MNNVNSVEIIFKNDEIKEYSNVRCVERNEQELIIYKDYKISSNPNSNKDAVINKKIVIFVDSIIGYSLIGKEE